VHNGDLEEKPKNWKIYRDGKLAASAAYHLEAKSIVRQLSKLHRNSYLVVKYEGRSISHCGDQGKPL
jgi:hypothetical protein